MTRKVRMGIDVGGTHTKAVAIDNATSEIIGVSIVKTTHDSEHGVAQGVVESFENCMKENNITADEIFFVAHSTTQATNALLEGDVAKVGVIGTAKGWFTSKLAKRQLNIDDIDLGTGRFIELENKFVRGEHLDDATISKTIADLVDEDVEVIVSSSAFGVDDDAEEGPESQIARIAESKGLLTSQASNITKLYGLTRRTRTAAINASILPTMLDTASQTESSVMSAGVDVPLMVMRGDGGVMEIEEMKKRPVLTMLSGPAASVMGALMYLRSSNGIYFEVGGTSTNLGVIKNGRPQVDYSIVGGHETYVSSLDVIVLGVAGGSMIRVNKDGVVDIGPRSAHIAGLDYAVFTDEEKLENCELDLFKPIEGDPEDYVRIKLQDGEYVTITTSCVANALGLIEESDYAYGNQESARRALQPVADYIGITIEEVAEQCLQKAYEKIAPVLNHFANKYKLSPEQMQLIGVGGGAASIIKYVAKKMELQYSIPQYAEIISSIGVALAMVRDVVERIVPNPGPEDIRSIRMEAINRAIESGADPDSIEVHVEIDSQTNKLSAIAEGSTEVQTDTLGAASEEELFKLAADDMRVSTDELQVEVNTDAFYVFTSKNGMRVLDRKGFIKVQATTGYAGKTLASSYKDVVAEFYETLATYQNDAILRPNFFLCVGSRIMDFDGNTTDYDKMLLLMDTEVSLLDPNDEVLVISEKVQ